MQTLKYVPNTNHYSYFIKMHVLLKGNFDDFQHILSCTTKTFDVIAISEKNITKQISLSNNLNLNYYFEFTPTETFTGGTILYIINHLSYERCNNLNIYKKVNMNLLSLKSQIQKIKYYCGSHLQTTIYGP